MFTLAKLAYYNCSEEHKHWYDTVPKNAIKIDLHTCCSVVMERRKTITTSFQPISVDTVHSGITSSLENGHADCLQALHIIWTVSFRTRMLEDRMCAIAARHGQMDCLEYMHNAGFEWDDETIKEAVVFGHLDVLRYVHEHGCPMSPRAIYEAASRGHLDCLRYLHEVGVPWTEFDAAGAAFFGQLETLKYLHENGCNWDTTVTMSAAQGNHLDCLRYAHENGCPWDRTTIMAAALNPRRECLDYATENGCPLRMEHWNR